MKLPRTARAHATGYVPGRRRVAQEGRTNASLCFGVDYAQGALSTS
jgi:hypothetical protein